MASIIKRKKSYSVVYNFTDENGETRQKWGVSMYDGCCGLIANYINPIIGDLEVQSITPRVVDKYIQTLQKTPSVSPKTRKASTVYVTNQTIEKIIKLLRCAFHQAVRWELIRKNPFEHTVLPKTEYKKRDIWDADTIRVALDQCTEQLDDNSFEVLYSVKQLITENETKKSVQSSYTLTVYVDESQNMVIIKNPTIRSTPEKSGHTPKVVESDGTVDASVTEEINEFLQTFFKLYPSANEKELSYYVKNNALKPIEKEYVFVELINQVYTKTENQISVSVSVKYLDQQTKATQVSQFELTLQKSGNWLIIK